MRKFILILLIIVILIVAWRFISKKEQTDEGPKQKAIAVSIHSSAFNQSIDSIMTGYFQLTESLVNWDSISSKNNALAIKTKLKSFNLSELKKDSSGIEETAASFLTDAQTSLDSLQSDNTILSQRREFNSLTQNMYDFLRTVRYDLSKLYLQQCPMAFNEDEPGVWLSRTELIRNPYMGIHHPHYGAAMIKCGETKDSLNFMHTK